MKPAITVIGGGTGTFVVLSGLRDYEAGVTAVMSMMDSGGSNRVLRDEFGLLPTSGIRQAIVALSEIQNDGLLLRKLFDYRYHQGVGISGMTFGNLFMAALSDIYGSQIKAIEATCRLLNVRGKILPITLDDSHLVARFDDGVQVLGEHLIDESKKHDGTRRIVELQIIPSAKVYPPVKKAILEADLIIFGPGDLYTNTIADLVVEGVIPAIKETKAKIVLIMNLMTKYGDSFGYKASDYISDLEKYFGKNILDFVLVNNCSNFSDEILNKYKEEHSQPVEDDLGDGTYYNRFAKTPHFSAGDEGKARFQASPEANGKAVESLGEKTLGFQPREAYKIVRGDFLSTDIPVKQKGDRLQRSLFRHDPKKLARAIMALI